jgi:hypothetical protein
MDEKLRRLSCIPRRFLVQYAIVGRIALKDSQILPRARIMSHEALLPSMHANPGEAMPLNRIIGRMNEECVHARRRQGREHAPIIGKKSRA